jgi:hypothetical protein
MRKATKQKATKRKATRKTAAQQVIDVGYAVWEAETFDGRAMGFLVTEPGDINRPVALVCPVMRSDDEDEKDRLYNARIHAEWIADDHALAGRSFDQPVIDLRRYGRPDSTEPVPGFVYGLRCRPVEDDGTTVDVEPVEPAPFCRFRLAAMQAKASSAA